jgi:dTMP kinase
MTRGKFIVIDGADGCGKTSVIDYLKNSYKKNFLFTREPGGTPFADKIREVMLNSEAKEASGLTQFGLIWAARADHVEKKIKPALAKGINVISDRFDSSTYAFQIYGQETLTLEKLFTQMREVYLGETKPDLYIVLDVNPHISVARTTKRQAGKNHFDERDVAFHRRIRNAFRNLPADFPKIIISSHDPVEVVQKNVKQTIDSVLANKQLELFEE